MVLLTLGILLFFIFLLPLTCFKYCLHIGIYTLLCVFPVVAIADNDAVNKISWDDRWGKGVVLLHVSCDGLESQNHVRCIYMMVIVSSDMRPV